MVRSFWFLVGVLLATSAAGHSQTTGGKKSEAGEVEVTFANGSVVKLSLLPEKIEVNTPYGSLTVPARDIRRIEFGMHLPDGTDKKIEAALQALASPGFKERDAAMRELVALGAFAYPSLIQLARTSTDAEATKRAQEAIGKIRAKVPANDLKLGDDDKIITPRFTIVGRIAASSFKTKSEYFGEVELSLSKLRSLRSVTDTRDADVIIDAGKYAQPGQWLDTGVAVDSYGTLAIAASGEIELRPMLPGTYLASPRGLLRNTGFAAKTKKGMDAASRSPGTLIGRIGENGEPFVVGDRYDGSSDREGKLYLQIVPSPYDNNSVGSYQVKIQVRD
jgi:hypothetical protein